MIGYYNDDDVLVGVASYDFRDTAELGVLDIIFAVPEHREHGIGLKLVRAAMSEYTEKRWLCQADKGNNFSQKLALSSGFSHAKKVIMF